MAELTDASFPEPVPIEGFVKKENKPQRHEADEAPLQDPALGLARRSPKKGLSVKNGPDKPRGDQHEGVGEKKDAVEPMLPRAALAGMNPFVLRHEKT